MRASSVLWLLLVVGCGSPPNQPSPLPPSIVLALKPGLQFLEIDGFKISFNPDIPACSPVGLPPSLTVRTTVRLEQDGNGWLARSTSPDLGTLVLRFSGTGVRQMGGDGISGTIAGSSHDLGFSLIPAADVAVSFDPSGTAFGTITSSGSGYMSGRLVGSIAMTDSRGARGQCPAVAWSMQPLPGGG